MSTRPTWAEISLAQLAENYRIIRNHVGPERAIMAIVKADAYGHGLSDISFSLAPPRVDLEVEPDLLAGAPTQGLDRS